MGKKNTPEICLKMYDITKLKMVVVGDVKEGVKGGVLSEGRDEEKDVLHLL